jgi:hypothetical protein
MWLEMKSSAGREPDRSVRLLPDGTGKQNQCGRKETADEFPRALSATIHAITA